MDDLGLISGILICLPLGFILHFLAMHYQIYKSDIKAKIESIQASINMLHLKISNDVKTPDNKN